MAIEFALAVDGLGLVMLGLIIGVGVPVALHARRSLPEAVRGRVLVLLALFALAMALLVTADDLLLLFLAWEATTVISFLLIGTKDTTESARAAARRALAVTGAGGLTLLVGLLILVQETGARTLTDLAAAPLEGTGVVVAAGLVMVGVATKSAHVPFHSWLPGAMAAPAPVSAYLHSATMVKAGVFLVARLTPVFAGVAVWDAGLLATAGAGVLVGGWKAVRATDLKQLLAWSTVSQLGLLTVALSSTSGKVVLGGMAMLVAHALAKASLFLTVGTVEAGAGTRQLSALRGLGRRAPLVAGTATVALASLAGVFPLFGFVGKEGALLGLLDDGDVVRVAIITVGSALTATYAARVVTALWARAAAGPRWTPPAAAMRWGPAALVAGVVVMGVAVGLGDRVAALGATAVAPSAGDVALKLVPSLDLAFGLSVLALATGILASRVVPVAQEAPATGRVVDALTDLPARMGAVLQRALRPGDGPATIGLLLGAAGLGAPAALLAGGADLRAPLVGSALQAAVAATLIGGAIVVAAQRQRFGAALALGVVGFGMTTLFVLIGAPDLALTQALVETIIVLAFLVVLRRMPAATDRRPNRRPAGVLRVVVAAAVGAATGLIALAVASTERISTVGQQIVDQSLPVGEGRNVVNVILTDVRALDTLGEIAVIGVAAFGVVRLLAGLRTGRALR